MVVGAVIKIDDFAADGYYDAVEDFEEEDAEDEGDEDVELQGGGGGVDNAVVTLGEAVAFARGKGAVSFGAKDVAGAAYEGESENEGINEEDEQAEVRAVSDRNDVEHDNLLSKVRS